MEDISLVSLINSFVTFIQNIAVSSRFFKLHPPKWLEFLGDAIMNFLTTICNIQNGLEQLNLATKLAFNCIMFPMAVFLLAQFFLGGLGGFTAIYCAVTGGLLGAGILELIFKNGVTYIIIGGSFGFSIGIYLTAFCLCRCNRHLKFKNLHKMKVYTISISKLPNFHYSGTII